MLRIFKARERRRNALAHTSGTLYPIGRVLFFGVPSGFVESVFDYGQGANVEKISNYSLKLLRFFAFRGTIIIVS